MKPEASASGSRPDPLKGKSAGKALQRVFHQEELFKRIEEQKASVSFFMNDRRRAIFIHLFANPCDHIRGIARAVKLSAPTVTWHLRVLTESGHVSSARLKKKAIYWPAVMVRPEDVGMVAAMRLTHSISILSAVVASPDRIAAESEIVRNVKLSQQNTNLWLGRLVDAGLLGKTGSGPGTLYSVSETAGEAVGRYRDSAKSLSVKIIEILESDGLRPGKARLRGTRLHVEIRLPGKRKTVAVECSPLADLARILK